MRIIIVIFSVLIILSGCSSLNSEIVVNESESITPSEEKSKDIKLLLELSGALEIGEIMSKAIIDQMAKTLKESRPDIPEELFNTLREEVNSVISQNMYVLIDQSIPLYHKYYTHQDIKELISFYRTDLGKKLIKTMPELTKESMLMGQKWGESLLPSIQERVFKSFKKAGVDLSA